MVRFTGSWEKPTIPFLMKWIAWAMTFSRLLSTISRKSLPCLTSLGILLVNLLPVSDWILFFDGRNWILSHWLHFRGQEMQEDITQGLQKSLFLVELVSQLMYFERKTRSSFHFIFNIQGIDQSLFIGLNFLQKTLHSSFYSNQRLTCQQRPWLDTSGGVQNIEQSINECNWIGTLLVLLQCIRESLVSYAQSKQKQRHFPMSSGYLKLSITLGMWVHLLFLLFFSSWDIFAPNWIQPIKLFTDTKEMFIQ